MPTNTTTTQTEPSALFTKVKSAIRITHNVLDSEIQDVIDAALSSLNAHGVVTDGNEDDALIINAVKLYAKWQFDYCGKADQFEKAWKAAIVVLALCGDYEESGTENDE